MSKNFHYAVACAWCSHGDTTDFDVLAVTHTLDKAQAKLKEIVDEERDCINRNDYKILTDTDNEFNAGKEGELYPSDYFCVKIIKV